MCPHLFSQQIREVAACEEDKYSRAYQNQNNRGLLFILSTRALQKTSNMFPTPPRKERKGVARRATARLATPFLSCFGRRRRPIFAEPDVFCKALILSTRALAET